MCGICLAKGTRAMTEQYGQACEPLKQALETMGAELGWDPIFDRIFVVFADGFRQDIDDLGNCLPRAEFVWPSDRNEGQ